jgi:hypothetical protein
MAMLRQLAGDGARYALNVTVLRHYVWGLSALSGCRQNRIETHAATEYEAVRAAGIVNRKKSLQAVLSVKQSGAKKCPEKLLPPKTLLFLWGP